MLTPAALRAVAVGLLASSLPLGVSACSPAPAAAPPPTRTADAFAVVRSTAEAAYQAGRQHLDRDELEAALVSLDQAKINDPDNRGDIQAALDETLGRLRAVSPTPAGPAATAAPSPAPAAASSPPPVAASAPAGFVPWSDPQGRFGLAAPGDWQVLDAPQALFGSGVVGFRDPSGQAEFTAAVDTSTKAVSPELYAAGMELAMQRLPGYALESVQPGSTAGSPSLRRLFTLTQRDAAGHEVTARGFQVALVRGGTSYVLSASAPTDRYQQFESTFGQMVDSFAFR